MWHIYDVASLNIYHHQHIKNKKYWKALIVYKCWNNSWLTVNFENNCIQKICINLASFLLWITFIKIWYLHSRKLLLEWCLYWKCSQDFHRCKCLWPGSILSLNFPCWVIDLRIHCFKLRAPPFIFTLGNMTEKIAPPIAAI